MANINDFHPSDITPVDSANISTPLNINNISPADIKTQEQVDEDKFGSTGQQIKAGLEGAAQGVIGPLAPLIETKVLGVDPEAIRKRAEVNPVTHGLSEGVGFAGSMLTGVGEGRVVGAIGEGAAKLLPEATSTIAKIATSGVKTGAELAALQASDEVSKVITQDPNQSLGSAAINIGLAGILGGVGGSVLGSVSPLWKAASEKVGLPDIIDNAKAQYAFRTSNPDLASGAVDELSSRMSEVEDLRNQMQNLKGDALSRAMPEVTPTNTAKIDTQIQGISDKVSSEIEKASASVKTKAAVPYLSEDLNNFQEIVTNPNASYVDKFNATNKLKQNLADYAKWGLTEEGSAKAVLGRDLSNFVRPALEDSTVWGEAGNVQKQVNEAVTDSIRAQEDLASKFTSKQLGQKSVDPNKVQTYLNQVNKSKAGLKTNVIENYLEHTQAVADTINKIHTDAGLEAPLAAKMNPTPILNHTLNEVNAGTHLGNWIYDEGLSKVVGNTAAKGLGAGLGTIVGHPWIGAYLGEKTLGPIFSSLAKPLLENASDSAAMKSAIDYVAQVAKGDRILNNATQSIFKASAEILPQNLIPNIASRDRLEKSLDHVNSNPQNMMVVGGNIGHYLPGHATAAAAMAATAQNYLNNLKPKKVVASPLDSSPPIDKATQVKYERALDIAQQPLMVLQHIKNGTLQAQDVQTLNTIYPNLHNKLVSRLNDNLIKVKSEGLVIPYSQRQGLSLLMGIPLDSTMTPLSMQSVIQSALPQQQGQQTQSTKHRGSGKTSGATLKQINKVTDLYQTPLEARASDKRG